MNTQHPPELEVAYAEFLQVLHASRRRTAKLIEEFVHAGTKRLADEAADRSTS